MNGIKIKLLNIICLTVFILLIGGVATNESRNIQKLFIDSPIYYSEERTTEKINDISYEKTGFLLTIELVSEASFIMEDHETRHEYKNRILHYYTKLRQNFTSTFSTVFGQIVENEVSSPYIFLRLDKDGTDLVESKEMSMLKNSVLVKKIVISELLIPVSKGPIECVIFMSCGTSSQVLSVNDIDRLVEQINVSRLHTGDGVNVGVFDSGNVDPSHNWLSKSNIIHYDKNTPYDIHATQVAGIIARIVPNATFYSAKINASLGTDSIASSSLQWMVLNTDIINISAGYSFSDKDTKYKTISNFYNKLVEDNRIIIVAAAGNDESKNRVIAPASAGNVIAVGATDNTLLNNNGNFELVTKTASYSAYQEITSDSPQKPNIVAPGTVNINRSKAITGTSFATPFVTGGIVQLLQVKPELIDKPEVVIAILAGSANRAKVSSIQNPTNENVSGYDNVFGAGFLNVAKMINIVENNQYLSSNSGDKLDLNTIVLIPSSLYSHRTIVVSLVWLSKVSNTLEVMSNYDISVYSDGKFILSATTTFSNAELLRFQVPSGVEINIVVTQVRYSGVNTNDIGGIAWYVS